MSEKELIKQISLLEKSLKGEKDLNNVLEIWGRIAFLSKKLKEKRGEMLNEQCC